MSYSSFQGQRANEQPQGGVLGTFIPIYVAEGRTEAEITCKFYFDMMTSPVADFCGNKQGL